MMQFSVHNIYSRKLDIASYTVNGVDIAVDIVNFYFAPAKTPYSSKDSSQEAKAQLDSHISDCVTIRVTSFFRNE